MSRERKRGRESYKINLIEDVFKIIFTVNEVYFKDESNKTNEVNVQQSYLNDYFKITTASKRAILIDSRILATNVQMYLMLFWFC